MEKILRLIDWLQGGGQRCLHTTSLSFSACLNYLFSSSFFLSSTWVLGSPVPQRLRDHASACRVSSSIFVFSPVVLALSPSHICSFPVFILILTPNQGTVHLSSLHCPSLPSAFTSK